MTTSMPSRPNHASLNHTLNSRQEGYFGKRMCLFLECTVKMRNQQEGSNVLSIAVGLVGCFKKTRENAEGLNRPMPCEMVRESW
jgi:hypothetical protein